MVRESGSLPVVGATAMARSARPGDARLVFRMVGGYGEGGRGGRPIVIIP
ncbi:hypothetical protein NCGM946K2_2773 [Mycobacterium tuberculosis]|nr:hypothetical protein NCGM946K2_2773 [Mycobacterium tuberculosis]